MANTTIYADGSMHSGERRLSGGAVVHVSGVAYPFWGRGKFVPCSTTAEVYAAVLGIEGALGMGVSLGTVVQYTDSRSLICMVRAAQLRDDWPMKIELRLQLTRLLALTHGLDWTLKWASREDVNMRDPHHLAASA